VKKAQESNTGQNLPFCAVFSIHSGRKKLWCAAQGLCLSTTLAGKCGFTASRLSRKAANLDQFCMHRELMEPACKGLSTHTVSQGHWSLSLLRPGLDGLRVLIGPIAHAYAALWQ